MPSGKQPKSKPKSRPKSHPKVVLKVGETFKGPKLTVFKYKRRKNYRRKQGHRQLYTRVYVESISK